MVDKENNVVVCFKTPYIAKRHVVKIPRDPAYTRRWYNVVFKFGQLLFNIGLPETYHIATPVPIKNIKRLTDRIYTRTIILITSWQQADKQDKKTVILANTKHLYNICTTLVQRRRRWADVVHMLYKCFVSAGISLSFIARFAMTLD